VTGSHETPAFRLAYVPGVTPSKWVRIWGERLPDVRLDLVPVPAAGAADLLRERGADAGLLRLPVDRTDLSAIPLYTETTVVVVPRDHFVAAAEEVALADLADEIVLHPLDDTLGWERPPGRPAVERPQTTQDAIELVAAGVGVLVAPQSLARLHHRRDLTYRTVTDAPQSGVALSWREDATTDLVDDFIGIVRGRTVNSTRGRRAAARQDGTSGSAGTAGGTAKAKASGQGAAGKPAASRTRNPKGPRTGAANPRRGKPRRRS
jgi:DNA-binding transcriptional LysR family regulator